MIKIQGTVLEIFANKMVTTNLGHPVESYHNLAFLLYLSTKPINKNNIIWGQLGQNVPSVISIF